MVTIQHNNMKLEIKLGEIIPVQCVTHLLHILMTLRFASRHILMTLRFASRQICFPGSKAIISAIWMHVEEAETKAIRKVKCGAVKEELKFRDMEVNEKLKLELERDLANLCKGIANFPALLQPCPDTALGL